MSRADHSQAPAAPRPGGLAPFRHAAYRNLWTASLISNFGGLVQAVAAAWVMTTLTDNPTLIALVQASNTLPIMLFALASGALADLFDRRRIMLSAQIFMAAVSLALALVAWMDGLTPWVLLGFTFLIGLGGAIYNPPWQASMGDLVPREDLPAAVTLNSVGFNLMRSVGPAAGGLIVAVWGAAIAFAINALSYAPLLVTLARWRVEPQPRQSAREPFLSAVGAGLRYVALSPNLLRVLSRAALFGLGAVALLALLPLVAKSRPEGGSLVYGALLAAFGAGAILGAFVNARARDRLSNETIVRLGSLAFAFALWVLSLDVSLMFYFAAMLPAGVAWVMVLSLFNVSVQLSTPRWVVARALALYQTATFGGMAAGSYLWGEVASAQGLSAALVVAALALVGVAAMGFALRLPEFSQRDLTPSGRFREPPLALDLRGRSGPIMVMVDYHIAPEDTDAFLRLMTERRAIRRRDGARAWALLRDLESPDHWSESYHIATWDDYVRHNMRRTKADAEVTEALARLHRGPEPPAVHRLIERQAALSHADVPLRGKIELP